MATIPLIDPATVKPYYINKGLSLELLDKCNAQEFRYADGCGDGYWLTTSTHEPAGDTITFNKGSINVELPILSILNLEHPDHSGGLIAVKTAEPKYLLNKYNVLRNYNVIDPDTILITGSVVTYDTKDPDATPKTLTQILTDILATTPFSLSYSGSISEVLNVYIEGLSVFAAIERICSIYGLVWTADNSTVYIQAVSPTEIDTTYTNDIRSNANTFHTMNIAFLKMNKCLEGPSQYHISQSIGSGKGMATTSYDPYYPAFVNDAGSVVNLSDITTRATTIRSNFTIIGSTLGGYVAKHIVFCPAIQPIQVLQRVHGDFGYGPRSILKSVHYPFYPLPEPDEEVCGGGGRWIQYIIESVRTGTAPGVDAPYNGLDIATVTVINASCADTDLIGDTVDVVDHLGCVFNGEDIDVVGKAGIAKEGIALSEDPLAGEGDLTPCHWIADDRCRPPSEGSGAEGVVFTLTSNLADTIGATATATVLVTGTVGVAISDTITVHNTGNKRAWIGAVGWAVYIHGEFWLAEIDQYPIRCVALLSADTHTFSGGASTYQGKVADQAVSVSISSLVATTPYPFNFFPSSFPTITNPYNLIGLSGDRGIVTFNVHVSEWQLIEILPQEKRRIRFRLTADMPSAQINNTNDFVPIETREFTSGEMPHLPGPPAEDIYDPMRLVVNGKEDDEGIAEYSYADQQWQVIAFRRRATTGSLEGVLLSVSIATGTSPHAGKKVATVRVEVAPCDEPELLNTEVQVVDNSDSQCIFDRPEEELVDVYIWANRGIAESTEEGAAPGTLTPCHWSADDRCCVSADSAGSGGSSGGSYFGMF